MARPIRRAGNLPAEATSFVGRRRELAELKKKLAGARLVTLVGPGGVGKSRLGLRAATDLGRRFARFHRTDPCSSSDQIWSTCRRTTGGSGIQGLAHFLGELDRRKRFSQERGSFLDTLLQNHILSMAGHEHDFQSGPEFFCSLCEVAAVRPHRWSLLLARAE